jgi:ribosome biogenesis GTPase
LSKEKPQPPHFEKDRARQRMKKAVKKIKPNRDARPPRRRDWLPDTLDDSEKVETYEVPGQERIMPRGERERRMAVLKAAYGEASASPNTPESEADEAADRPRGTVIEVSSGLCRVAVAGRSLLCTLRGSLSAQETGYTNVVACGDVVIISESTPTTGVVEQVLPRRSALARQDVFYGHLKQIIVANADQLLVVASWREPHIWTELIDRYLITAARDNLEAILCINKIDLAADRAALLDVAAVYRALGVPVILTSAHTGEGIDALRKVLAGQSTVLAGLSGVGKSSLLSAAQPGLNLRVSNVSEYHLQGQHTTTQVSMWPLESSGYVIDTPGIREFGLAGLSRVKLATFYPEVIEQAAACRFSNCAHVHEPECAVRAAAGQGKIASWRYENYTKILATLTD